MRPLTPPHPTLLASGAGGRGRPRGSIIAALDLGTAKACCLIARVEDEDRLRLLGFGERASRGLQRGLIVHMAEAADAIRHAVAAAEEMAQLRIESVVVALSPLAAVSRLVDVELPLSGRVVGPDHVATVMRLAREQLREPNLSLFQIEPVDWWVDGQRGVQDPRGLMGQRLGARVHLLAAPTSYLHNLARCLAEADLSVDQMVLASQAAGLATLQAEERSLGTTLVDFGAAVTSVAVFVEGRLIHADAVALGGGHVTNDLAHGLSTGLADAERIKTLYGAAVSALADDRELVHVPGLSGEHEGDHANHVPRSLLVQFIRPRVEETLEQVRALLDREAEVRRAGRKAVLTGGASQLPGLRELAEGILGRQVRLGRPQPIQGLPDAKSGPAYAVGLGLLQAAMRRSVQDAGGGLGAAGGLFGRMRSWLQQYW